MARVGIVRDPVYLEHKNSDYHPETPLRLSSIYAMLDKDMGDAVTCIPPRPATHEEIGWVHFQSYINQIAASAGKYARFDPDTGASPKTYEAALMAAGGAIEAVDAVMAEKVDIALALVRPPGHHAERNRAMGFCIFNNVAIAAEHAMRVHGLERILIVDWDLHHGNGTANHFWTSNKVMYQSTHQYPFYPGSGDFSEKGGDDGVGFTINVPMPAGCGDGEYLAVVEKVLVPVAYEFKPELLLMSAGFDIYEHDPLGGMKVTPDGFVLLNMALLEIAKKCCNGRTVVTLEGGYHIEGETLCLKRILEMMLEWPNAVRPPMPKPSRLSLAETLVEKAKWGQKQYWKSLAE